MTKAELTTAQKAIIERLENDLRNGPFVDGDFNIYKSGFVDALKETIEEVRKDRYRIIVAAEDAARIKRRQAADEYRPKLTAWAIENLKPGMFVKMRGCNDGTGLREVIELKTETRSYGRLPTVVCWQVKFKFWDRRGSALPDQALTRVQRTEHLMDKIIGIAEICTPEEAGQLNERFTYRSVKKIIAESEDI